MQPSPFALALFDHFDFILAFNTFAIGPSQRLSSCNISSGFLNANFIYLLEC